MDNMKPSKVLLLALLVILFGAALYGFALVRRGFSAREQPSAIEAAIAAAARNLSIPAGAASQRNPFTATPEILTEARAHFADHCATCHANNGSGQTEIGQDLYPRAPDMRLPATQHLADGQLYYIIHNGVRLTGHARLGRPAGRR